MLWLLNASSLHHCSSSGSPPMPSTSSSSLTNEVPKPPAREQPATRPPYTPTLGGQAPHSHQFPRTRKMFDKGPEQVKEKNSLVGKTAINWKKELLIVEHVFLCAGSGSWRWWGTGWSQELRESGPANRPVWLECQVFRSACHEGECPGFKPSLLMRKQIHLLKDFFSKWAIKQKHYANSLNEDMSCDGTGIGVWAIMVIIIFGGKSRQGANLRPASSLWSTVLAASWCRDVLLQEGHFMYGSSK